LCLTGNETYDATTTWAYVCWMALTSATVSLKPVQDVTSRVHAVHLLNVAPSVATIAAGTIQRLRLRAAETK